MLGKARRTDLINPCESRSGQSQGQQGSWCLGHQADRLPHRSGEIEPL